MSKKPPRFIDFARQLKKAARDAGTCAIDITPGKDGAPELTLRTLKVG